ncbi:UDP-N-acetylglucosamine 2-epimerase (non-hydrolyzing) [Rhodanobacter sp. B04]|uniref:non-hydrolyzing UDP-N-acetylglucosamine 2-epimerase n=1 Tax=Rhodanobacter sp. B04 TaxID=1945860 RepID=UPI0009866BA7|nr:UDP-N-acetylglucosamine 2-epimerase (non-hydrolyzing) [Rhodanobacter sp. B04]OOG66258.1 UDP-N-acetylglucosamine 2-epimerase (non-hydrolyzing) [Rhodanobacter sp. B04]
MKIITIVGARPQFIKAAVVSRAFANQRSDVQELIVHTGQHYDANMSDVFFDELDIPRPKHHLGIGGGTHGQNTGRMIEKIEALLLTEQPDWMLVYGDTDSTLAGALAACKLHVPVAHVEAGLRSYNRRMPEEINRLLTDHVASLLLVPSERARCNLHNEGISGPKVQVVGDVMYDAALYYLKKARRPTVPVLDNLVENEFVLCTIHRAENTDDVTRLTNILSGLAALPTAVILPLHPRTRARMTSSGIEFPANVRVIEPVGYLEMVWLEAHCRLVLTDSGGVQKEAYFHGKPCITLRDETEWVELVEIGANCIVGASAAALEAAYERMLSGHISTTVQPYGKGRAAELVVKAL